MHLFHLERKIALPEPFCSVVFEDISLYAKAGCETEVWRDKEAVIKGLRRGTRVERSPLNAVVIEHCAELAYCPTIR